MSHPIIQSVTTNYTITVAPPAAYDYGGTVTRVIDGDTIVVTLSRRSDVGFGAFATYELPDLRLRLAGLDARPIATPDGRRAAEWLIARVMGAPIGVRTVKNAVGADKREKYGRYLAMIYLVERGCIVVPTLNEQMLALGLAVPYDGRTPRAEQLEPGDPRRSPGYPHDR